MQRAAVRSARPSPRRSRFILTSSPWRSQRITPLSETGSKLRPVGPQALDRLGPVADQAPALQLEHPEHAHQLGLRGRAKLTTLAQDHLGDRDRVTGIGLARFLAVSLAMGAQGRHLQGLVAGGDERGDTVARAGLGGRTGDWSRPGSCTPSSTARWAAIRAPSRRRRCRPCSRW